MKISVVSDEFSWAVRELVLAAKRQGIELEIVDVSGINSLDFIDSMGEVVIWRSSSLDLGAEKATCLELIKRKKVLINPGIARYPYIPYKLFQQKVVADNFKSIGIPTFKFKNGAGLDNFIRRQRLLDFPLVVKPSLGGRGRDVRLLKNWKDLDKMKGRFRWKDVIFQGFIPNNGDYRVLIVGGKALGVVFRRARKGVFANNASLGASVSWVRDKKILKRLGAISSKITNLFGLFLYGLDIMEDKRTGKLYFMELNTKVGWKAFQKATGINVSDEVLKYCRKLRGKRVDR
ncbi:MAG: hypothetical protein ABIC19_04585 [Patescibacteria group bacterium]|nr:hypothetical protein [Patescibacteria group bacterium]